MNQLQGELNQSPSRLKIVISGVNQHDRASGNDLMCMGRDLAWLQDDATKDVWNLWEHAYRDVVILDEENKLVERYNLTDHPLDTAANYEALKSKLLGAAK